MLTRYLTSGYEGDDFVFTGRNKVVAKVIFLHMFVILFTGGVLPQCMLGYQPPQPGPPGSDTTPQDQTPPHPRNQADTPGTRQTPHPPSDTPPPGSDTTPPGPGRHPPRTRQIPPDQTPPPTPRKQTPAYGLRAAGTHPTGMHSCSSDSIISNCAVPFPGSKLLMENFDIAETSLCASKLPSCFVCASLFSEPKSVSDLFIFCSSIPVQIPSRTVPSGPPDLPGDPDLHRGSPCRTLSLCSRATMKPFHAQFIPDKESG